MKPVSNKRPSKTQALSFAPFFYSLGASLVVASTLFIVFAVFVPLFPTLYSLGTVPLFSLLFSAPTYFIAYQIGKIYPLVGIDIKILIYFLLTACVLISPALVYSLLFTALFAG